jgi:hypothetical protein
LCRRTETIAGKKREAGKTVNHGTHGNTRKRKGQNEDICILLFFVIFAFYVVPIRKIGHKEHKRHRRERRKAVNVACRISCGFIL